MGLCVDCFCKGTVVTRVFKCFAAVQPFFFFFFFFFKKLPECYCIVYICDLDNKV